MGHQVAYGKMTVNGVDFAIDHVVVNLKGTYYQNYERECTYTINADKVQNNVFWFTTETFENVTEFTVTAYDAEGKAVTKTVDVAAADKTLAFNYGRVSTFSVSGLEAAVSVIKVKDVDTTASNGVNLSLAADGKIGINVDIDALAAKVIEKHVVEFDADTIKTTDAVGSNEAGASVQTVLENLESRIQAAVSGGVTSVAAGNGIVVNSTDPNNPKVSVNVVSGSSLKATADGLDLVWEQI
jgi:hypothetical protein